MNHNHKFSLSEFALNLFTALFSVVLWLINLLPFRLKIAIGKGLGLLLYRIPNSRTGITRKNLSLCFPECGEAQRERIARDVFKNFGAGIIESAMSWWSAMGPIHRMTELEGGEHLEAALALGKSRNTGVILVGAHFSTLDLSALLFKKYYPFYVTYRVQNNRVLNWVMGRGRLRSMTGGIPHTEMRTTARTIMQGNIVWYAPDQDMGEEHSVFAPFFGHPAATLTMTAKLSKLTRAPIVMLSSHRKADDSGYVLRLYPGPESFPTGDPVEDATIVNGLIEQGIRQDPGQYYWFHRRFKTQPGLEKSAIYRD